MAKLKVYRTAIGFHDAYVAASSQKAALKAWGSDKNLFAHGAADVVTDPVLTAEPLASPGKVIKRLRGTADEQMAALPPDRPKADQSADKAPPPTSITAKKRPPTPKPPPSRGELEEADAALDRFEAQAREKLAELKRREEALAQERKRTVTALDEQRAALADDRDRAAVAYDNAVRRWKES